MAGHRGPDHKGSSKRGPRRGLLARPLDSAVFLLPLILFYELVSVLRSSPITQAPERVVAFTVIQRFLEMFGPMGLWAPPLAVVAVLLATHAASGEQWRVHWPVVGAMYGEAVGLCVPMLILNWAIPLIAGSASGGAWLEFAALGVGAGVYEELVFRLVLITLMVMVGVDMLRLDRTVVAMVAVAVSALLFAAHHHPPIGDEPFEPARFCFRTLAGAYLAVVFWYRGYGPAAGCHAAYNTALAIMGSLNGS